MDPSVGRPLILARPVAITPSGSMHVCDENVVLMRSDSGRIQHFRSDTLAELQESSTSLFPDENDEDRIFLEVAQDLEVDVDSGSEVDDEELTEEELRQLQYVIEEEEQPEDASPDQDGFIWQDDYATFRGEQEDFNELSGPKIEGTSPIDLFLQIWDQPVMSMIVEQTNSYAWQTIAAVSETGISAQSRLNDWVEVSVSEIYRLFAIFLLMGVCYRARIDEYWHTGTLGMQAFRKIMTLDRFWLLMKFLHFIDNNTITPLVRGHERKICKIAPILNHCNNKFPTIYTPRRELSIDESLLLWKGRLSWVQCIRTKAARFGVKSFELCEALTGYCIKINLYSGKGSTGSTSVMGFTACSAKIVLNLMTGYLGKGYSLFMDNFYNSVPLTRFLKRNRTDVVGTLNRRRNETPHDIKTLNEKQIPRGQVISRHCGDVSVESWKDVRLVTTVSTYHKNEMLPGRRAGQPVLKPTAIHQYNMCMGGVDLKDQKLSAYLLERKRGLKWYLKVFKRILNTSVLNSYIIHCANIGPHQRKLTHRNFRLKLAEELCRRFGTDVLPRNPRNLNRLNPSLGHYPEHREVPEGERTTAKQNKLKRARAPVHIITGSAGCREGRDHFRRDPFKWSAFHSQDYGFTKMKVYNTTHINMEQVSVDLDGQVIDSFWLVKNKKLRFDPIL